jgi:phosphatidylinositol kinase/protein kinase (PI-3  family)
VKFLLKGNEDVRLDERLMQFFALINNTFVRSRSKFDLPIVTYAICSLTKEASLIKWVTGTATMHQMVIEDRGLPNVPLFREFDSLREHIDSDFRTLDSVQKLEMFEVISKECRRLELFEYIWLKSPNAAVWVHRTERFIISSAVMSMIGYIIGLGDRHPSNLMVQNESRNIIHIDFGESFDSTLMRNVNPERVSFRLTKMIVNALEGSVTDGFYRQICIRAMQLIRKHKAALGTQLAIFLQERLEMYASRLFEFEEQITERVFRKLDGKDLSDDGCEMKVQEQVDRLIGAAVNPYNYLRHYMGWCPFW